jgi:hypothetical protein
MASRQPRYAFYERVIMCAPSKGIDREIGAILGRVQNEEDGAWHYSVYIYHRRRCWSASEEELEPTGEIDVRETFYDGTTIEVDVDSQGYGRLRHSP